MKVIHSYHHHDGSVGVLAEFECGTDFTARTPEFKKFMDNMCMTIAFSEDLLSASEMVHSGQTVGEYLAEIKKVFQEDIRVNMFHKMKR